MSYADFKKSMEQGRGGNFSKSSLVDLATNMFNEPDCTIPIYIKKGESYVVQERKPGVELRNAFVAPILRSFGVDKAELPKLASIQTSRAGGEALADFGLLMIKEYIDLKGLGRRLTLPMTSPEDTAATIGMQEVAEETKNTTKIVKAADSDSYVVEPTGKAVTTLKHYKLVGKNKTQPWQKISKDIK